MEKIHLAICDDDQYYVDHLGIYILSNAPVFNVIVFNHINQLKKYIKDNSLDIILMKENAQQCVINEKTIKIILSEDFEDQEIKDMKLPSIYKYMSADKMIEQIKYIYKQKNGKKLVGNDKDGSQLIGFFSATGGVGTSVITLTLCRILSLKRKRVLYFNLENIPSTRVFFSMDRKKRNLSDFLYYFFIKKEEEITTLFNQFIFYDSYGVESFLPQSSFYDLYKLTEKEIDVLFEFLCNKAGYDYVFVDCSNTLNKNTLYTLSKCDKIFKIIADHPISKQKAQAFLNFCKSSNKLSFLNNAITIINFCKDNEKDRYAIPNDDESFRYGEDEHQISLDGKFGASIKKIAEAIFI